MDRGRRPRTAERIDGSTSRFACRGGAPATQGRRLVLRSGRPVARQRQAHLACERSQTQVVAQWRELRIESEIRHAAVVLLIRALEPLEGFILFPTPRIHI